MTSFGWVDPASAETGRSLCGIKALWEMVLFLFGIVSFIFLAFASVGSVEVVLRTWIWRWMSSTAVGFSIVNGTVELVIKTGVVTDVLQEIIREGRTIWSPVHQRSNRRPRALLNRARLSRTSYEAQGNDTSFFCQITKTHNKESWYMKSKVGNI
jgi:hypothetical protein